MRKKVIIAIIGILVITLGVTIIIAALNPLRKSNAEIRNGILELTPIGMNMEDVMDIIANKDKWRWDGHIIPFGLRTGERSDAPLIGVQSIRATIGSYHMLSLRSPFGITLVVVFWAFDENSELIEVFVRKQVS
jgi:hypothetical protein